MSDKSNSDVFLSPFSEWSSQQSDTSDPIRSHLKYYDYVRDQYVKSNRYNEDIEKIVQKSFAQTLNKKGLLTEENVDSVNEQIKNYGVPTVSEDILFLAKHYDASVGGLSGNERIALEETLKMFPDGDVPTLALPMNTDIFRKARANVVRNKVAKGEIDIGVYYNSDGQRIVEGGNIREGATELDAIKEGATFGVKPSDLLTIRKNREVDPRTGMMNYQVGLARRVSSQIGELLKDPTFKKESAQLQALALAKGKEESWTFLDEAFDTIAEGAETLIEEPVRFLFNVITQDFEELDRLDEAKYFDNYRDSLLDNTDQVREDLTKSLSYLTGASEEIISDVLEDQIDAVKMNGVDDERGVQNLTAPITFDEDELEQNVSVTKYFGVIPKQELYYREDLFIDSLAAAGLSDEEIDIENTIRIAQNEARFATTNEVLQGEDGWQEFYTQGVLDGLSNNEIVQNFVEQENPSLKWRGFGLSLKHSLTTLLYGVPAMFNSDWGKEGLIKDAKDAHRNRELAKIFGVEMGWEQNTIEMAAPLVADMVTTALSVGAATVTGGASIAAGGAFFAAKTAAKQSAIQAFRGVIGASMRSTFSRARATGIAQRMVADSATGQITKETTEQVLKRVQKAGAFKGVSGETITKAIELYNGQLAKSFGLTVGTFVPAATRSAGSTYGTVFNTMEDSLTQRYKNPDGEWTDGWSEERVKEEAHSAAYGSALISGTITGLITTAFGKMFDGKLGGVEGSLLKGMSYKQLKIVTERLVGKTVSDKGLLRLMKNSIKDVLQEHGGTTLSKYGYTAAKLRDIGLAGLGEGIEESLDEFLNGVVTDTFMNSDTPLIERLKQSFTAGLYGFGFGATANVGRSVANRLPIVGNSLVNREQLLDIEESIVENFDARVAEAAKEDDSIREARENLNLYAPTTREALENALTIIQQREEEQKNQEASGEDQEPPLPEEPEIEDVDNLSDEEATTEANQLRETIAKTEETPEDSGGAGKTKPSTNETKVDPTILGNPAVQKVINDAGLDPTEAGQHLSAPKVGTVRRKSPQEKYESGLAQVEQANYAWRVANELLVKTEEESPSKEEFKKIIEDGIRKGLYLDNRGAARARQQLKDLRDLDLEEAQKAKTVKVTEADKTSVERLINYGYPVSLIEEHLAELGLELDNTEVPDLIALSDFIKKKIEEKFPVNKKKPTNAAAKLPADLFSSLSANKVLYLDSDGNGIFNNDPQQMLTFLRSGIDIPVSERIYNLSKRANSKVNPSFVFRFDEVTQQAYVDDILVPVSGGRVSANSNFGFLTDHKSDYRRISKLLVKKSSNEETLSTIPRENFEIKVRNPIPTTDLQGTKVDTFITLDALLEKARDLEMMVNFVRRADEEGRIPSKNKTTQARYYNAAGMSLSIRLQNRIYELARDAGSLDATEPLFDFTKMRDQEITYYARMARERKERAALDLSRLMKFGSKVQEDPSSFDVEKNAEDIGIPPTPDPLPVFAEAEVIDYMSGNYEAITQALENSPELRSELDDFLDFEYHGSDKISISSTRSASNVTKDFVNHLLTGENIAGQRTLDFIKRLDSLAETNNDVYSLVIAMRALGLSSPTIHPNPDADLDLLAYIRSSMVDSFGPAVKDLEVGKVMEFFDHLRNAMVSYRQDAVENNKTIAKILQKNITEIEQLGLVDGDPESVIAAFELIAKSGKPRFLRSMARAILTNKDYIRSVEFRITPSKETYAGLYEIDPEKGTRRVIINPNRSGGKAGISGTLLHEYLHAFTVDIVAVPRKLRTPSQNRVIDNLERMRLRMREKATKYNNEGALEATRNVEEFIAYTHTSVEFRNFLGGDFIQRVIDAIARFFKLASKDHFDLVESLLWASKAVKVGLEATQNNVTKTVARHMHKAQEALSEIADDAGLQSTSKAQLKLAKQAQFYTSWVRRYVPAEVIVETSDSSPVVAKIDDRTGNLVFNPKRAAVALDKLVSEKDIDPERATHVLAAVINEEIGHAAANEMLTDAQILEVVEAMTDADFEAIIKEYYPMDQREGALARLRSLDPEEAAVEKYKLANEAIVAHASMAMRGMTTNQQVAFLSTNPSLIPTFIQYLKALLSKLTYHRTMKDLSPEMRNAVNSTVREIRAMELGYRPAPNSMEYNGRNAETIINQLVNQAVGSRMLSPESSDDIPLWSYPDQEISSAATSINQIKLPSTFGSLTKNGTVVWEEGTVNADIGGGSFDNATEKLAELGVENLIYDPFNRTRDHNEAVVERIANGGADTATVNNVLNVIQESGSRDQVIAQASNAIKKGGTAYFLIYEGSKAQQESGSQQTSKGWQNYRKAETYISEIEEHFGKVTRKGNLLIATQPKQDVVVDLESQFGADILMPVHDAQQAVDDAMLNGTQDIDAGIKGSRVHMLGRKMQELVAPKDAVIWDKNWKGSKKDWPTERARAAYFSDVDRMGDRLVGVLQRALNEYPDFVSWYEERVAMAMDIFEELDPDIKNPQDNFVMKTLMTVTSNGNKVKEQTEDSWALYQNWKKTGKLVPAEKFNPDKTQTVVTKSGKEKKVQVSWIRGDRQPQIKNHLALIDKLIEKHSWETVSDFLSQKGTVKELRAELVNQFGFSKSKAEKLTKGELIDEEVPFSLIFGAKLGSFYNNLNGDFDTVTMDRWFMRTFGRTAGQQLRKYNRAEMKEKHDRFDTALKNYLAKDPSGELFKEAGLGRKRKRSNEFVIKLDKHWTKAANRQKAYNAETKSWQEFDGEMELFSPLDNELRLATNALSKAVDGYELIEAPANGGHRRFIRLAMNDAIDKLEQKHGITMVPAEAQAILWYYEKAVHAEYGSGKDGEAPDYATAAHGVFQEVVGERAGSFRESTANIRRRDLRDSTGGASERARRYNLDLESQFGADSNIPTFLDEVDMQEKEFGQWLELLDVPLTEMHEYDIKARDGSFGRSFKRFWIKTFQRKADRRVVQAFDLTNAMIRETKGLVADFQKKHDRLLSEEEERLGVTIPATLIAQASGTTQGTQLTFDQEDQVQGEYLNALEKAQRLTGSARESAIDEAAVQKEQSIQKFRDQNRDAAFKTRDKALKELLQVSPKMYALVVQMRKIQDQISKKGMEVFKGSMKPDDLRLAFDYNRGLYITRRYRMFDDNDFARDVLESEEYAAVREKAAEFFARQKAFQSTDEVMDKYGVGYLAARQIIEEDLVNNKDQHMDNGRQLMRAFVRGYRQGEARRQLRIRQGTSTQDIVLQDEFTDEGLKRIAQTINEKKNIPDVVRDLLGEYTEEAGLSNLAYSILHTNSMLANQSFFNKIKELGTKSETPWLITEKEYNEDPDKYADWKKMKADAGEDDLAPIKGLYMPSNIAEDLEDLFSNPKEMRDINNERIAVETAIGSLLRRATGLSLALKTMGSVGFYFRNMLGNALYFGPMQGYTGGVKLLAQEGAGIAQALGGLDDLNSNQSRMVKAARGSLAELEVELLELKTMNVFGDELEVTQIQNLLTGQKTYTDIQNDLHKAGALHQKIVDLINKGANRGGKTRIPAGVAELLAKNGIILGKKGAEGAATLKDGASALLELGGRLASAADAFFKIGLYNFELDTLMKAAAEAKSGDPLKKMVVNGKPTASLKQMAAEIVKDTAQSYSRSLPVIKDFSKNSLALVFAPYVRFAADVPRVFANGIARGIKEFRSDNKVIKARGRRRLLGALATTAGSLATTKGSMFLLFGWDHEDEDKALRMTGPEWQKKSGVMYLKIGGKIIAVDMTYVNPFANIIEPMMRAFETLFRTGDVSDALLEDFFGGVAAPFINEQIFYSAIRDSYFTNTDQYGQKLIDEAEDFKGLKKMANVFERAFAPKTPSALLASAKALYSDEGERAFSSPLGILLREVMPIAPHEVDLDKRYRSFLNKHTKDYRSNRLSIEDQSGMTDGELRSAIDKFVRVRKRQGHEFNEVTRGFEKLGKSWASLKRDALSAGVSKERWTMNSLDLQRRPVMSDPQKKRMMQSPVNRDRYFKYLEFLNEIEPDPFMTLNP